jgi:hypothetical protein
MFKKSTTISPIAKDGYWCLHRRVPKRIVPFEKRAWVTISTSIRVAHDPRAIVARSKVESLERSLQQYWGSMVSCATAPLPAPNPTQSAPAKTSLNDRRPIYLPRRLNW